MKVHEVTRGTPGTLRLRSIDEPIQPVPRIDEEVMLVPSAGRNLLKTRDGVWAVAGHNAIENSGLEEVVASGQPLIAYVANGTSASLVIETRRFAQEVHIPDAMQVGIDEKALDDIRRA